MKIIGMIGMIIMYPFHLTYMMTEKGWLQKILPVTFWGIMVFQVRLLYGIYEADRIKSGDFIFLIMAITIAIVVLYCIIQWVNDCLCTILGFFLRMIEKGYQKCIVRSEIKEMIEKRKGKGYEKRKQEREAEYEKEMKKCEEEFEKEQRECEEKFEEAQRELEEEFLRRERMKEEEFEQHLKKLGAKMDVEEAFRVLYLDKGCSFGEVKERYQLLCKKFRMDSKKSKKEQDILQNIQKEIDKAYIDLEKYYVGV